MPDSILHTFKVDKTNILGTCGEGNLPPNRVLLWIKRIFLVNWYGVQIKLWHVCQLYCFLFSFSLILVKFEEYFAWHRMVGGASDVQEMLDVFQRQHVAANLVKCELISGLKENNQGRPDTRQPLSVENEHLPEKKVNINNSFVFWHFCGYHCCLGSSKFLCDISFSWKVFPNWICMRIV